MGGSYRHVYNNLRNLLHKGEGEIRKKARYTRIHARRHLQCLPDKKLMKVNLRQEQCRGQQGHILEKHRIHGAL